jgi:hypothetical protein
MKQMKRRDGSLPRLDRRPHFSGSPASGTRT